MLNAVHDIFYVLERDGSLQRWNESLSETTGYSDAEIESMNAIDFVDDDDRERIADAVPDGFETGNLQLEAELLTKDGESIPYEFAASALETSDGEEDIALTLTTKSWIDSLIDIPEESRLRGRTPDESWTVLWEYSIDRP